MIKLRNCIITTLYVSVNVVYYVAVELMFVLLCESKK